MVIYTEAVLELFKRSHMDAARALDNWYNEAEDANWIKPEDVRKPGGKVRVKGRKARANIRGKRYRLLFTVGYKSGRVYLIDFLPHKEYNRYNNIWEDHKWYR